MLRGRGGHDIKQMCGSRAGGLSTQYLEQVDRSPAGLDHTIHGRRELLVDGGLLMPLPAASEVGQIERGLTAHEVPQHVAQQRGRGVGGQSLLIDVVGCEADPRIASALPRPLPVFSCPALPVFLSHAAQCADGY
jgi:hypothetical protein